jgi:hypothetical protein
MDGHELECALACYAILIERAERDHGKNSKEATELRKEYRDIIKKAATERATGN